MTNLYISSYLIDDSNRWGLFYEDEKGIRQLTEDFKPVAFDTEDLAKEKLKTLELEKASENIAKPFSFEDAKEFVENHKWKFATTYAQTAPHEYLVKKWLSDEDRKRFERLVQAINRDAVIGYFYGHENKYLILGEYYYWYMPCYPDNMAVDLINRSTTDYLEYRDGAYYYKPRN